MKLHDFFVTNAGQVGLLQSLTEYTLEATFLCFLVMAVFCLASKDAVTPEHRASATITALICLAAGVSYALIRTYYHAMLETLVATDDPAAQHRLIYQAYINIGQYRYMDWTVTTPLLLVKNVIMLRVKPHQAPVMFAVLLAASPPCSIWSSRLCFIASTGVLPTRPNRKNKSPTAGWPTRR